MLTVTERMARRRRPLSVSPSAPIGCSTSILLF
jgi:hypothetical protein